MHGQLRAYIVLAAPAIGTLRVNTAAGKKNLKEVTFYQPNSAVYARSSSGSEELRPRSYIRTSYL